MHRRGTPVLGLVNVYMDNEGLGVRVERTLDARLLQTGAEGLDGGTSV